jgi:hypothetical protein
LEQGAQWLGKCDNWFLARLMEMFEVCNDRNFVSVSTLLVDEKRGFAIDDLIFVGTLN